MTIQLTVEEVAKLRLCSDCVGESFLSAQIERLGVEDVCSYCDGTGKTYSIAQTADEVSVAFRDHYDLTRSEPDLIEYHMTMDDEINYQWEREGDPVQDVIIEAAEVSEEVAEDLRRVLEDRELSEWFGSFENPFDPEAYYEVRAADDTDHRESWLHLEESLTTESRFFNPTVEAILTDTFADIDKHRTDHGPAVIIEAGPNTQVTAVFRARVFQANDKLEEALKRPDLEVGPPPAWAASHGRMNPHGVSVFYGATDPTVALAEVRPPVGSRVIVGRFEILRPLRLLDIKALRSVDRSGSIFDRNYIERLRKASFLDWLSERITQPVMPNDEPFEYLPTQAIADFLATRSTTELDGIIYPSVQAKEGISNVVLFHKSSRVEALDIPKDSEISVYSHNYSEDGQETAYSVHEEIPPIIKQSDVPFDAEPDINDPLLLGPLQFNDELNFESREVTLKLDVTTLEVRYVKGVEFDTDIYQVSRHRSEKRQDSF